jgi:hypothetical protein
MDLDTGRKYSVFAGKQNGLAGFGEFYLDCQRFGPDLVIHSTEGARRALAGILPFRLRRPTGVAFPGETRTRISCDLATGSAGIGLFIHRFLKGGDASFMLDDLIESRRVSPVQDDVSVAAAAQYASATAVP